MKILFSPDDIAARAVFNLEDSIPPNQTSVRPRSCVGWIANRVMHRDFSESARKLHDSSRFECARMRHAKSHPAQKPASIESARGCAAFVLDKRIRWKNLVPFRNDNSSGTRMAPKSSGGAGLDPRDIDAVQHAPMCVAAKSRRAVSVSASGRVDTVSTDDEVVSARPFVFWSQRILTAAR